MVFYDTILSYLIIAYMFVLPIFPSKYKFNGIPLNGDVLLAIIILFYLMNWIINKNVRNRFINYLIHISQDFVAIFAGVLLIVMALSVTYSTSRGMAIGETVRFGTYFALYMIIKLEVKDKFAKRMLMFFMFMSLLLSIIGLLGICFNYDVEKQASTYGSMVRIESTLENSNNLGAFLMLSIFPFFSFTLKEKNLKHKILFGLSTAIIFISILCTQSRNALLALLFGCCVFIIIYNWKSIIFFIFAFIGMFFIPATRSRLMQIKDPNQNISRIKLWRVAIDMIKDHPILGVGNGNYPTNYDKYKDKYKDVYYNAHGQFHPHNAFLKVQCELGIAGTVAFVSLITSIFIKIRNLIKSSTGFYKIFYNGFIVSLISFMMLNVIDNFFSAPKVIAFFWIIIALAEAIINNKNLNISN